MYSSYSISLDIKRGVPQRSIFGPLLFNALTNDLFMLVASVTLPMTAYSNEERPTNIIQNLTHDLKTMLSKFEFITCKLTLSITIYDI